MDLARIADFFLPTRVIFGLGSLDRLGEEIRALPTTKVILVTDKGIAASGIKERALSILAAAGVSTTAFDEVEPEPSVATVGRVLDLFRGEQAEAFVAIGGGSAMDAAKAAAVWATNGGQLRDYGGDNKFDTSPAPVIAIPTTAGTGSEVSHAAAISDPERHAKFSLRHARLNRTKLAILDPTLLTSVPRVVAVDAGLDALAHAVESYTALKADFFTEALSLRAVELIAQNLRSYATDRGNIAAGAAMMAAAAMASIAFCTAGTGNGHCLARHIGPKLGLTHGRANAILLPHVIAFNEHADPAKFARLAQALGASVEGKSSFEAAREAAIATGALCADLDVPSSFRGFAPDRAMIPAIAQAALDSGYNQWNPRFTTYDDFVALLGKLFDV